MSRLCPTKFVRDSVSGHQDKVDLGVLYLIRVHYIFLIAQKLYPKFIPRSPSS
ncbi:hypothetical protein HanHA300_Chr13g0487711 [Helianthus annuus]|nr:hypothetical protein HanHA300_Chr13g0487711 [Helianthus annuus]KAJ0481822.1 hypothetical protein HanIR_Chr13g0647031 [Helianthus annuus]KAJ0498202.1 hypothetical protein HanHA89_Chr13g0519891 [Helianthus annuus]KAJ0664206.1 hypothetical protein HanLR1_Chr13g0489761 [Helianthus annuus]KAJ0671685.1 hypothetical protein HanOQP8_Chr13g0488431 [Helianthus annuus]